jgi:formyltetrahydrofolate-dependent phosphoribosylglycinamide formyltransferase
MKTKTAVLISGRGSNMMRLVQASYDDEFAASIDLVISNRADAPGLDWAQKQGIPTELVDHRYYHGDKQSHEQAIHHLLEYHAIELVCLAGYMRFISPWLVTRWRNRILNIHPSILPSFPGLDTHAQALAAGVKLHGCTVHWVNEEVDAGEILAQVAVPVLPNDTVDTLAQRVLFKEHQTYPDILNTQAKLLQGLEQ